MWILLNACQTCSAGKAHIHFISTSLILFTGERNFDEEIADFPHNLCLDKRKPTRFISVTNNTWILVTYQTRSCTISSLSDFVTRSWLINSRNWNNMGPFFFQLTGKAPENLRKTRLIWVDLLYWTQHEVSTLSHKFVN